MQAQTPESSYTSEDGVMVSQWIIIPSTSRIVCYCTLDSSIP